ncbi:hypothetical protein ElyMa_005399100 [Elysia marginata]|uniref:Uncharacterized protein n=1 Tax=Elysia marginata TaxID=1093978 RepID=A0AAV4EG65_9GAST|nr:hypothetical protein ElyMa_005399100 [Elysia marginata]
MAHRSPKHLSRNWFKIAQQACGPAPFQLVNPGRCKTKVPEGYTYECFNSKGQPTVWSTIRHFESARVVTFWKFPEQQDKQFLEMSSLDRMLYIASLKLSCEPDLYNTNVQKQPVETDNELVYVGNTSFKIRSNLFMSPALERVAHQDISLVFIDPETKRPSMPATWWKEKYAPYSLPGGLDSSVGRGLAPWPRGRGFEPQPSTVRAPTGWVSVSIM